jgi:hypothetical protein
MPMNTSDTLALWAIRETDTQLSPSERAEIATRLRDVLDAYYVHLPQKNHLYGHFSATGAGFTDQ